MTRLIEMMRTMVENHNGWVLCSFCPDVVSQPTTGNPRLQVVLLSFGDKQISQMIKSTYSHMDCIDQTKRLKKANNSKLMIRFFLLSLVCLSLSLFGEKNDITREGLYKDQIFLKMSAS